MNKKDNQRTRVSKLILKNATMDLLKEKGSITKISVRELCERAELNRSTFYAHYNEPKDILTEIEDEILQATADHLEKIGLEIDNRANKYILSFLKFIRDNDKTFRTLLIDSMDPDFRSKFMGQSIGQFVTKMQLTLDKEIEQYVYSYLLNGSTGIITQWIRSNYAVDENTIVNLLFSINKGALIEITK